ncbi:MAG: hypothetical protein ABSC29_01645 [Minisyncoccia bacterium]|jgi:hypothetical protein
MKKPLTVLDNVWALVGATCEEEKEHSFPRDEISVKIKACAQILLQSRLPRSWVVARLPELRRLGFAAQYAGTYNALFGLYDKLAEKYGIVFEERYCRAAQAFVARVPRYEKEDPNALGYKIHVASYSADDFSLGTVPKEKMRGIALFRDLEAAGYNPVGEVFDKGSLFGKSRYLRIYARWAKKTKK